MGERADAVTDVRALASLLPDPDVVPEPPELVGPPSVARSAFDVDRLLSSTALFAMAATGVTERPLDLAHLLAWCTSTVLVDGEPVPSWADLSGVYPTADGGHVQVHCNFPHHADAVTDTLGVAPDREAVAAAMSTRRAEELETDLVTHGAVAAALRSLDEWERHPHRIATADLPLVSIERIDTSDERGEEVAADGSGDVDDDRPMRGVRVLDCSRVLAGPIAGHLLAGAGGDVIRLGAAHLPAVDIGVLSTGAGKRNAFADLRTGDGRRAMADLLAGADVWIDAYRPGALAGHGFTPERAAALRPGIVVVQISAFDTVGPWAGRRGFDSIVQTATGVRDAGGRLAVDDDGAPLDDAGPPTPRGLPVQALDDATGFLAAGVAAALVRHHRRHGGSWLARLSLLRTRDHLVGLAPPHPYAPGAPVVPDAISMTTDSEFGRLTTVAPFLGGPLDPPRRLGTSHPAW